MDRSLVTLVRNASDLLELAKAHELVVSSGHSDDRFLANLLVQRYGKCGSVRDARAVFDGIRSRNAFSWAIMLAAYVQNGHDSEALDLFAQMSREGAQPDEFAFASVLGACGNLKQGKAIHAQIESSGLRPDVVLGTALVNMYAKCWAVEEAKVVFDQMAERNVVTWTAMITAFAQGGLLHEALQVLKGMDCEGLKQNDVTFISLLGACSSAQDVHRGREVYARAVACGYQSHTAVQNAAVNMFVKCGSVPAAKNVFEGMEAKDLVSWNEMIAAFTQKGLDDEAVELFWRMNLEGFRPNDFTFSSVLGSCSVEQGTVIHQCIASSVFSSDTTVQNALLNMYAKAGKIQRAKDLFDGIQKRTLVSWTTMITAYSQHGRHEEALEIFKNMILEGFEPDDITFISILNACSHAGLLYQGTSRVHDRSARQSGLDESCGGLPTEAAQPFRPDPVADSSECVLHAR
ncbi:pentatricopeptide repeat-containing protein At2g33680 isoform X1 [Selaginella moellendorffii]|uniref:pentatricopeptide repeat-containing protein At2g33680 isoform X1 n=1 Tax=Selaginella moellendorffii TaxID=88036 RepID=UPI000D1D0153|nr:pentatricopeptide repeat-containing protein At2g33680 isoform X1 [Selaginella moellendorffii]|eukprot:XP_024529441.1 pentatricopeptide repeat-containing protein At2g33680 isoform X1 [Selaginella moellendorffii]